METQAPAVQPPLMLAPFDPVEALLADVLNEAGEALKQGSGADHDFWESVVSIFLEERLFSFDTSVDSFKERLLEQKDSFDYAIRFMGRMLLRPYFVEAASTVYEHFIFGLNMIGFEGETEDYEKDPLLKLMMLVSLNKPVFTELRSVTKLKLKPKPGR